MTSPTENPKPKTKQIFKNLSQKTSRIRRFEQLSSSIAWRVMVLQSSAKMCIKGKPCFNYLLVRSWNTSSVLCPLLAISP